MRKIQGKKGITFWAMPLVALLLGSSGCTNTVRYLTTLQWMTVPPGAVGPGSSEPAPGAAPAAPAAPGGAGDGSRVLYVTYWEGSCSSGIFGIGKGCSLGDSKIRRCNVRPDNVLACVDELEATQSFARKK